MKNFDARSIHPKAQETLRVTAVRTVIEEGKTHQEVADLFGVARGTVIKWVSMYKKGGYEALKAKKQGRPKGGKLKGWQAYAIARIVVEKNPEHLKFPWALWTRELVGDLIYQKYGIRLSVWTVGRYLKRWRFTPQKPL
ncbi:MAG TPA: transposase, partial [Dissulfuribacter thermophilus]|nr:transposase [Dissulfuribacter thermophilus]